jgi:hypothetical protein
VLARYRAFGRLDKSFGPKKRGKPRKKRKG